MTAACNCLAAKYIKIKIIFLSTFDTMERNTSINSLRKALKFCEKDICPNLLVVSVF